jgi:hypothetical protein
MRPTSTGVRRFVVVAATLALTACHLYDEGLRPVRSPRPE